MLFDERYCVNLFLILETSCLYQLKMGEEIIVQCPSYKAFTLKDAYNHQHIYRIAITMNQ